MIEKEMVLNTLYSPVSNMFQELVTVNLYCLTERQYQNTCKISCGVTKSRFIATIISKRIEH